MTKQPKIFVLGANGMLGTYVCEHFTKEGFLVVPITRNNIDITKITKLQLHSWFERRAKKWDVVINCAGVIKPQIDKFGDLNGILGNSVFPFILADVCEEFKLHMCHISSDCTYTGAKGNYVETDLHDCTDVYGKTKSLGEPKNCTVIRTSIIGEEKQNKRSLIEWIKNQKNKETNGYRNHFWNGLTCLELAKVIHKIIDENLFWQGVRHIFSKNIVSKDELLKIVNDVYNLNIRVNSIETPVKCDRSLSSIYDTSNKLSTKTVREQVEEMFEFNITDNNIVKTKIEVNE